MEGHYQFVTEEGDAFLVSIARFVLDATGAQGPVLH
jgi:uncharacterized protein affecting Mg2+/Co2+ transport